MKQIFSHLKELSLHPKNAKELKGLILQLAVQGKLTKNWRAVQQAQGMPLEHASVLLERIKEEKAQLVQEKKIKKGKPLPEITEDEIPYELPKGWVWSRFIDVAELRHGHQFRKYDFVESGIPVVKIGQCKSNGTLDLSNCDYIDTSRQDEFKTSNK